MSWKCNRESFKVLTADKDIPVFKLIHRCHKSMYRNFYWNLGLFQTAVKFKDPDYEANYVPKTLQPLDIIFVNEGFHSWSKDNILFKIQDIHIGRKRNCGLHKNLESLAYHNNPYYIFMYCRIPAGTDYVVNNQGEYVSEYLNVISFLEDPLVYVDYFIKDPGYVSFERIMRSYHGIDINKHL